MKTSVRWCNTSLFPSFCAHVALGLVPFLCPLALTTEAALEKTARAMLGCKQARLISEAGGYLLHLPAKAISPELLESPILTR